MLTRTVSTCDLAGPVTYQMVNELNPDQLQGYVKWTKGLLANARHDLSSQAEREELDALLVKVSQIYSETVPAMLAFRTTILNQLEEGSSTPSAPLAPEERAVWARLDHELAPLQAATNLLSRAKQANESDYDDAPTYRDIALLSPDELKGFAQWARGCLANRLKFELSTREEFERNQELLEQIEGINVVTVSALLCLQHEFQYGIETGRVRADDVLSAPDKKRYAILQKELMPLKQTLLPMDAEERTSTPFQRRVERPSLLTNLFNWAASFIK